MVEQRGNLDYGRDDETPTDTPTSVEGDGFTMTDTDLDAATERPETEQPPAEDVDQGTDDAQEQP